MLVKSKYSYPIKICGVKLVKGDNDVPNHIVWHPDFIAGENQGFLIVEGGKKAATMKAIHVEREEHHTELVSKLDSDELAEEINGDVYTVSQIASGLWKDVKYLIPWVDSIEFLEQVKEKTIKPRIVKECENQIYNIKVRVDEYYD